MSRTIEQVGEVDLPDLLPLLRAYCTFYGVQPSDEDLLAVALALIRDPKHEGLQLMARDSERRALGFATLYWSWSTLIAARQGTLNDLFVSPEARGTGLAEALLHAARARCAEHGAAAMVWQTAKDNRRAQAVYERIGATRAEWVDFALDARQTTSP